MSAVVLMALVQNEVFFFKKKRRRYDISSSSMISCLARKECNRVMDFCTRHQV